MIACKDYELGVCGKQTVLGNAEEATITFVTTKPKDSKYNDFSVVSHDPWITVPTDYTKSEASYINLPTTADPTRQQADCTPLSLLYPRTANRMRILVL